MKRSRRSFFLGLLAPAAAAQDSNTLELAPDRPLQCLPPENGRCSACAAMNPIPTAELVPTYVADSSINVARLQMEPNKREDILRCQCCNNAFFVNLKIPDGAGKPMEPPRLVPAEPQPQGRKR